MIALNVLPELEEEAKKRRAEGPAIREEKKYHGQKVDHDRAPHSTDLAASMMGTNRQYVCYPHGGVGLACVTRVTHFYPCAAPLKL